MTRSLISFLNLLMFIVIFMEFFLGAYGELNTSTTAITTTTMTGTTANSPTTSSGITNRGDPDYKKRGSDEQDDYGNGATARRTKIMTTADRQQSTPAALGF